MERRTEFGTEVQSEIWYMTPRGNSKYMFKGPDHSYYHIPHPDEDLHHVTNGIKDYIDNMYLCAPEAARRIIGFHLIDKNLPFALFPFIFLDKPFLNS